MVHSPTSSSSETSLSREVLSVSELIELINPLVPLSTAVDASVATDPAEVGDVVLCKEIVSLRAEMDRLDALFARLVWAAHQRGVGSADGSPSTAAWLRRRTSMREGDARAAIESGEVCEILPTTAAAWRAGEISGGAARTILGARVKGHDAKLRAVEPALLGLARDGAIRELQRTCAHFRNCAQADGTEPRDHDGLSISKTYGGRTVLNGNLSSSAAETVVSALHALTDPPSEDDHRSPARRRADALVRMAELALAQLRGAGPEGPVRSRPAVTMVIDWPTLMNNALGRMDGEFTGTFHRSDVERLLCDSFVTRVVTGPKGQPIDVGRARRTIPTPTRQALVVRDEGCRYPGCGRPPGWCDAHHVIHWQHGGRTDLENLVLLCDHHHHVAHQPGSVVKFDGEEFRVITPEGIEIT